MFFFPIQESNFWCIKMWFKIILFTKMWIYDNFSGVCMKITESSQAQISDMLNFTSTHCWCALTVCLCAPKLLNPSWLSLGRIRSQSTFLVKFGVCEEHWLRFLYRYPRVFLSYNTKCILDLSWQQRSGNIQFSTIHLICLFSIFFIGPVRCKSGQ